MNLPKGPEGGADPPVWPALELQDWQLLGLVAFVFLFTWGAVALGDWYAKRCQERTRRAQRHFWGSRMYEQRRRDGLED